MCGWYNDNKYQLRAQPPTRTLWYLCSLSADVVALVVLGRAPFSSQSSAAVVVACVGLFVGVGGIFRPVAKDIVVGVLTVPSTPTECLNKSSFCGGYGWW